MWKLTMTNFWQPSIKILWKKCLLRMDILWRCMGCVSCCCILESEKDDDEEVWGIRGWDRAQGIKSPRSPAESKFNVCNNMMMLTFVEPLNIFLFVFMWLCRTFDDISGVHFPVMGSILYFAKRNQNAIIFVCFSRYNGSPLPFVPRLSTYTFSFLHSPSSLSAPKI